jgi:Glycine-rich domain-containing protein-like
VEAAAVAASDDGRNTSAGHLLLGFDLHVSSERQSTFFWQVSGKRFQDDDFLEEGVEKYTKFLKLKQKA